MPQIGILVFCVRLEIQIAFILIILIKDHSLFIQKLLKYCVCQMLANIASERICSAENVLCSSAYTSKDRIKLKLYLERSQS